MSLTAVMDQNCVVWTQHPHYCQPRNNSLQHETHCNDNWVCCVSLLIFSNSWQVTRRNTSTVTERFLSSHSSTDFSAQLQLQEIFSRWWTQVVCSGVSSLTGHWQDYTIHQFSRSLEVTRLTWQIQLLCNIVFIVANLVNISLWSGLVWFNHMLRALLMILTSACLHNQHWTEKLWPASAVVPRLHQHQRPTQQQQQQQSSQLMLLLLTSPHFDIMKRV